MSLHKPIADPPEGYRLLEVGELTKPGDAKVFVEPDGRVWWIERDVPDDPACGSPPNYARKIENDR